MNLLKKHLIPTLIVILVSLGVLYLPQLLITYNIPYLSSLIETRDLSEGLVLHYSFDQEVEIPSGEEKNQILLDRLEETLSEKRPSLHLSLDRQSLSKLIDTYSIKINGDPKTVEGKRGEALSFDGDDSLTVENFDYAPGSFAQSVWIYSDDSEWGRSEIDYEGRWITRNVGELGGLFLNKTSRSKARAGYRVQYKDGKGGSFLPATIEPGKWYHLMASYDEDSHKLRVYLNGKLKGIKNLKEDVKLKPWRGLQVGGSGSYWFGGIIDDVRVFNESLKIAQPPGVVVTDDGPHEHTGIIHGNPEFGKGRHSTGLYLDGKDDYITTPDSAQLDLTNGITFSFWINPRIEQTLNLLGKGGSYYFWLREDEINFTLFNNGEKFGSRLTEIPLTKWSHITGVYDEDGMAKIYVNGKLAGERGPYHNKVDISNHPLQIGNMNSWKDSFFAGSIDEVRIYNQVLPEKKISALAQGKEVIHSAKTSTQIAGVFILITIIFLISYYTNKYSGGKDV